MKSGLNAIPLLLRDTVTVFLCAFALGDATCPITSFLRTSANAFAKWISAVCQQ